MLFKSLRTRSKSSNDSKSVNATATRRLSNAFSLTRRDSSKIPTITISPADHAHEDDGDEEGHNDYQEFLEKARREEEDRERKRIVAEKEARKHHKQVDMSPWASRI